MSMVSISPQKVKQERIQKGYPTQEAAVARTVELDETGEGYSVRQWSRVEASKKPLVRVRRRAAELIAKTLRMSVEDLGKPPTDEVDAGRTMQEAGYRRIAVWLGEDVRLNYRWVTHHYGVSVMDLINAAPWMFALLAEMSLADRRRQLEAANTAFEDAMRFLPKHLSHGAVARGDFDHAYGDENDSLADRDVFGRIVLETDHGADPFDPSATNPFFEFIRKIASDVGSAEVDFEDLEISHNGMPRWPVFQNWLHELTGGDRWARFAVENVKGVVDDMPSSLKGAENTAERVRWLVDKIPAEMRAEEEERCAKAAAKLEEMGFAL
jgi:hypothetical protein